MRSATAALTHAGRYPPAAKLIGLALAFAACIPLAPRLRAQSAAGRLSGTVIDASGAAIPGAAVLVRNESTGVELRFETNAAGGYSAGALPAVFHTLEISADGFSSQILRGVKVDVAAETSVPPVELQVGSSDFTVEVVAEAGGVQASNAELTRTVTQSQIDNLPIIGRNPLDLVGLQAGVNYSGAVPTTINGQRTSSSNVTFDGINIQDNFIRTNSLDFLPNRAVIDQIAEFTLTTQNGNAAGSGGSSQVNFLSRSGGTEFHGNFYGHNRNSALSANEWFSNRDGLDKPFLNRWQAGASLGGPLIENRLFFYANYEAFRERADTLVNSTVLTESARRGIFTYIGNDERKHIVNVLNMQELTVSPQAQEVIDAAPGAESINNFDVGDSDAALTRNTAGYRFLSNNDGNRDSALGRFDLAANDRSQVSGTYQFTREDVDRPDIQTGFHTDPVIRNYGHTQLLSVGWRWSPGPRWSNELRGGFNLAPGDFRNFENRRAPDIGGFLFTNPVVNFDNQGRNTDTFNLMNNASVIRGKHSLRFGFWSQRVRIESFDFAGVRPSFSIGISLESPFTLNSRNFPGGASDAQIADAESLLATLAGLLGSASQTFHVRDRASGFAPGLELRRRYSFNSLAGYVSDNWKISPRLTVELGLRWDYQGRFNERGGLMLSPVEESGGLIDTLLGDAVLDFAGPGSGRVLYNRDLNNFAPNFGIAYDPFGAGKTVIRAGYGIHFVNDEIVGAARNAVDANNGLVGSFSDPSITLSLSDPALDFAVPEFKVPRRASENFAADPYAAIFGIDPNLRTPYAQEWQFSIQHEVSPGTIVEARYLGNKGTKLLRGFDYNQIDIFANGYFDDFQRARSNGFLALAASGEFDPQFDPRVAGSRRLTFFPLLEDEGVLSNSTVQGLIRSGQPGSLAGLYIVNRLTNAAADFRRNRAALPADLVTNFSNSSYHALQLEIARRARKGLGYQLNYSFSKVLTDSSGANQVRFDPFLDIHSPSIERGRADFDITHVINGNTVWELPFGRGKRWSRPGLDKWIGGWSLGGVVGWQTGAPLSIYSGRGTLNRSGRSGKNTADTVLDLSSLKEVVRLRVTPDGPYIVDRGAINPRDNSGVSPDGEPPFEGQLFFHPAAGKLGALQRNLLNGPSAFTLDLALGKETEIGEGRSLKFGAKVANILNHPVFYAGDQDIDNRQFGRIRSTLVDARVVELYLRYSF